jgi:FMN phosphatase YigB (HAD superfamily)
MPAEALLLDVGYVIIDVTWPAVAAFGKATGRAVPDPGALPAVDDPLFERRLGGTSTTDGYWDGVARLAGFEGFLAMFRALLDTVPDAMIDSDATALISAARAAGKRTGALSNDAYTIAGREFFAGRPEFAQLDVFVDATEIGIRKPAAEAYLRAAAKLGVQPKDVVFLDDTPECVDGARQVGMMSVHVDPSDKAAAFDRARDLLGLAPSIAFPGHNTCCLRSL